MVAGRKAKAYRLNWLGNVEGRAEAKSVLHNPGDTAVVFRGYPRWFVMLCPCGCGEELAVNLDRKTGPAWRLYESNDTQTLYPSIWLKSGCRSHFIVWGSQILWVDDDERWSEPYDKPELDDRVLHVLTGTLAHFEELARLLDEIPWAVLSSARRLAGAGKAIEGTGKQRGQFRLAPARYPSQGNSSFDAII